jgi:hypothetical protein
MIGNTRGAKDEQSEIVENNRFRYCFLEFGPGLAWSQSYCYIAANSGGIDSFRRNFAGLLYG